ncbi:MAG: oxidoreductase [Spirochaetaceae bacterium]|nr:MAG: oxidoreductase [Spirochaetaceae bacterium]
MDRIVVTPRSMTSPPHAALERLRRAGYEVVMPTPGEQPDERRLIGALAEAVGYLAGVEKVSRAVLEAAPRLRVISRNGVGIDNVDMEAARERGVQVMRAEGVNARGVAELTIAHMLAACRRMDFHHSTLKNHAWQRRKGIELNGRTVGIVGCGRIGRAVAELCLAFGMTVRAFDPYVDAGFRPAGNFGFVSLDELLQTADILSLHAPVPEDGVALLDAAAFARMKAGVMIVNTARFELLDAQAVRAALEDGTVAVLTLDAFQAEPPEDWSLIDHENVIATPHIGGFTVESVERVTQVSIENLLRVLSRQAEGG